MTLERPEHLNLDEFEMLISQCWSKLNLVTTIFKSNPSIITTDGWITYLKINRRVKDFSLQLIGTTCFYIDFAGINSLNQSINSQKGKVIFSFSPSYYLNLSKDLTIMNNKPLRTELNNYLCLYLIKKNLKMKPVIKSIRDQIINGYQITENQFSSIISFIEREPEFKNKSVDEIYNHFSPLIKGYTPRSETVSLDQFFQ